MLETNLIYPRFRSQLDQLDSSTRAEKWMTSPLSFQLSRILALKSDCTFKTIFSWVGIVERYEISCLMVHKNNEYPRLNFCIWISRIEIKNIFAKNGETHLLKIILRFRLKKKSFIHVTIKPLSRFSLWLFDHVFDWLGVPLDHPRASWVYRL